MIAMNAPTPGITPRALVLATVATLAATALAACGRIPGQFEIVNNQVPRAGCSVPVDETVYAGQGLLDLSLVQGGAQTAYFVFPLLKNNLAPSTSGPDVNQIFLSSFAVDIRPLGPAPAKTQALFDAANGSSGSADYALLHYKTPWSGSVASGGGKISSFVAAFPVDLAARINATQEIGLSPSVWVNLRIRAFGSTTVQDIESDPFDYPVALCSGCLVANLQPCPYTTTPANTGNPCNVAQDYPVDCCLSGSSLVCPAVVAQ
jgi:hypothetical protein